VVQKQTYNPRNLKLQTCGLGKYVLLLLAIGMQLSYAQMIQIISPSNGTVSKLHNQVVTAKGWDGFDIQLWVNGSLAQTGKVRPDGVIDFMDVNVPSGDVKIETRIVNPDGSLIDVDSVKLHILGTPMYIKIELSEDHIRANSSSIVNGKVQVLDEWGYPIQEDYVVTLFADAGKILTQDLDPQNPGIQVQLKRGFAEFEFQGPTVQGIATITAQVEQAKSTASITIDMPLEPLTLVGLVDASAYSMKASGDLNRLSNETSFRNGLSADGRVAAYARGTIGGDYLITASYDSDRRNRNRLFRDLDPNFLYSIYGDNSLLTYDVQTQSPLFAKVEKDRSYLLLGDFNSELSSQEFTKYDRSLAGVKGEHRTDKWNIRGFGSLTNHQVVHKEIRGEGLSGFYNLGYSQITPGSEQVRIETRDKYHSEVVINREEKTRYRDYDIDYDQGTIFFKQPVSAFDQFGNSVWIVVTYEAITDNASTYIAGATVERQITDNLSVNLTGITEEQSPKNYNLFGASTKYQLGNNANISGEIAHSSDFARNPNEKSSGNAYKMEVSGTPIANLMLRGYYRRMEEGFFNIRESGGRKERGSIRYGASGGYLLGTATKLNSEYYETLQETGQGQSKLTSLTTTVDHQFTKQLTGQLRIEDLGFTAPDTLVGASTRHSTLAILGASYAIGDRAKVTAQHERNLGSSQDATRPNATALATSIKVMENTIFTGEERFYEGGGNLATLGLTSTVTEGTQVYSKYEIGNSVAGRRNMISIGIRNTVKLPYDLTANLGYERAKDLSQRVDQTATDDHTAYSAGLEYLPKDPVKASAKFEYGDGKVAKKTNVYLAGDYRFQRDFSFILKYNRSNENSVTNSGYRNMSHLILGMAYRPTESNLFNAIGKFEVKGDKNHYLAPFIDYGAVIGSVHTYLEPIHRFELGIKLAYKVSSEESEQFSYSTHTSFYLLRGSYDITEKLDASVEYRALVQAEAKDILSGYSIDAGYAVMENLKLVVGYNFKGYKDRDLVENNVWSAGPFVKFSYKFGEELFGK